MENKNIQIVQKCVEQIMNHKQLDRIYDYYSQGCIFRTPPYVGLGIMYDDSSGESVVINQVAENAPATGKVQVGDVVLRASDEHGTWEGFERLRAGSWGLGALGSEVSLSVLRDGQTLDVTLVRSRIDGFDSILSEILDNYQHYLTHDIPDYHSEINRILASGDLVAYFATNTGTSAVFHHSAVWTECNIVRLENGKIVEWWGVEDTLSMRHQFGFHLVEPLE